MIANAKKIMTIKEIIKRISRKNKKINVPVNDELRPMALFVNKYLNGEIIGVEIGSELGRNAEQMLRGMNLKKLYLIDPYEIYENYNEEGKWLVEHYGEFFSIEKEMKERLAKYKDKYLHIKKKSSDATEDVPNNLDFVYIDGNHSYEYVLQDIELYYKKIKNGGIIGGHDFNTPYTPEVTNAVIDFVKKNNLQLFSYGKDWWIIKGEKRRNNNDTVEKYGWPLTHLFESQDEEWWCGGN
ncbi:Methyltransferase domain protein [uncultured archaeon]|nr:Methyltransferase domain protein [uncultured archaeon]